MHFLNANLRELSHDDRVELSKVIVQLLDGTVFQDAAGFAE